MTAMRSKPEWVNTHARMLGLTLVTHNMREFERVKGFRIENWTK